ncbi:hypothetical protein D5086_023795 [Populus alba]|uniref:Uncharacterized protein n=1 Tax=Populus alba TaxID=43335 RepID=A0ACC4BCC2_POPAL
MAVLVLLLMSPLVSPLNDEGTALSLCTFSCLLASSGFSLCLLSVFEMLQHLYFPFLDAGSLKMVILAVKWIKDSISFCVCDCERGGIYNLSNLNLGGEISPAIGDLRNLQSIDFQGNKLTGQIPEEIGNCASLFNLDVRGNNLSGTIPSSIGNCTSFEILYLHGNKLTGPIPPELGNMSKLSYLDLSSNNFSGPIPASIGDLEHLLMLDVSFNNVTGSIPVELGQLQNIVTLILNNNDLQGEIPNQLTNCFSLANLNFSYNNLSGIVPPIRNLTRFPPDSFIGNPLLCGNWLGSVCGPYVLKSKVIFSRAAVVCITLGFVTLLSMIVVVIYKSNQRKQLTMGSDKTLQGPPKLVVLHMDMAIHTFDDIMRNTENLSEKYIIGYGASSTVYKCVLKNSRPLAIKRLYNQYPYNLHEFETELETIGSIRHRNIVSLHGYALSPRGNLLFYDYMKNGSLWDLLHGSSKKVKLDWETRLKVAVGAAQGLAYLHHDCNPRIIHRDVKSSNILLDEDFEAHLSDFGIAKCIPTTKTHASTFVLGTIGYIDPEYARTSRLTEKSDVYSFGIVLLELLTGKKAVDNESNLQQLILSRADDNTVMEAVDPEVSVTCMDLTHVKKSFQLALLCTKRHPSERPTMQDVSRVLVSFLPALPTKASLLPKPIDYAKFVIDKGQQQQPIGNQQQPSQENNSSDAQWFVRFKEVVSKNTL